MTHAWGANGAVRLGTALLLAAVAGTMAGCQRSEARDLFSEGERLCLDGKWDQAAAALKAHLLEHPEDPGAHFYLGRCYMTPSSTQFRPALAVGEIETALALFHRNGKHSTIARFSEDYFEYICNIEMAKVRLLQIQLLRPPEIGLRHLIKLSRQYIEAAEKVRPNDEETLPFKEMIERLDPPPREPHSH